MRRKISDFFMFVLLISIYIFTSHEYIPYLAVIMFCLSIISEKLLGKISFYKAQRIFLSLYFIFYIVCILSYFQSIDEIHTIKAILKVTAILVLIIFLLLYYQKSYRIEKTLHQLVVCGSLAYIYILIHPDTSFTKYIGSVIGNRNIVGLMLAISFISGVYFFKSTKKKRYLLISGFLFSGVLLTASRQAIITSLLGYFIFMIIMNRKSKVLLYKNFVRATSIIAIVYLLLMNNEYLFNILGYRITNLTSSLSNSTNINDGSINARVIFIKNGINWFSDKPFLGYGLDNFKILSLEKYGVPYYSHNNFIEVLVTLGLVGFISFYGFYVYPLYKLWIILKSSKERSEVILSSILFSIISMFIITGIASVHWNRTLYYILLALSYSYIDQYRNKQYDINKKF